MDGEREGILGSGTGVCLINQGRIEGMPLSTKRDKQRKRLGKLETDRIRLEKLTSSPQTSKPVQLKDIVITKAGKTYAQLVDIRIRESLAVDDDGHPIPEL